MRIPSGYQEKIETPQSTRAVEAVWSHVAERKGCTLILPDGRCDVIVRYNTLRVAAPVPVLTGPATQSYAVRYEAGDAWVGVRLRPENGAALWGRSVCDVQNSVMRGQQAVAQISALAVVSKAAPNAAMIRALLLDVVRDLPRAPREARLVRCLERVHMSGGRMKVAALAETAQCSARHLNRLFLASIGLPAKTYGQLVQFHRGLRLICDDGLSLADAAFEAGYSDHAHMARAMRRFGGFAPSRLPEALIRPNIAAQRSPAAGPFG